MKRRLTCFALFLPLLACLMAAEEGEIVVAPKGPTVTIDKLTTGANVGGTFVADYSWKDCTGVASVKVIARQSGKDVGSGETTTTQATASQKDKLVTTTGPAAGSEVEVTAYAYDALGAEIAKSTTKKVNVK